MNEKKRKKAADQFGEKPVRHGWLLTLIFSLLTIIFISPIFIVLMNSFKQKSFINLQPFSLPKGDTFVKLENYARGIEQTGFFDAFKKFSHYYGTFCGSDYPVHLHVRMVYCKGE